jgi:hypothetical protein
LAHCPSFAAKGVRNWLHAIFPINALSISVHKLRSLCDWLDQRAVAVTLPAECPLLIPGPALGNFRLESNLASGVHLPLQKTKDQYNASKLGVECQ